MKIAAMVLLVGSALGQSSVSTIYGGSGIPYPNDTTVGTVCGYLAKVTSTGAAAKSTKTDGSAIIGVANAPPGFMCGTSGMVLIARRDVIQVSFDGTPSAGDFACVSATVDAQLHDCGTSASAACVGRISTPATNFGGFYNVSWGDCGVGGAVPVLTPTTTTLTASPTSPAVGGSVVLTSTVASSSATGTVSFLDGSTTIGSGTLSGGTTAYTVNSITAGSHPYKAIYSGDTTYATSTSNTVTVATPVTTVRNYGGTYTGGPPSGSTVSGTSQVLVGATGTFPTLQTGAPYVGQTLTITTTGVQYIGLIMPGANHTFQSGGLAFSFNTPVCSSNFTDATGVNLCFYGSTYNFNNNTTFTLTETQ